MERAHLEGVLRSVNWQKATAAKILGVGVKTLGAKIKRHKLSKAKASSRRSRM
jgi:transcriptional regulator with GAF, ATPase, and Fis domain